MKGDTMFHFAVSTISISDGCRRMDTIHLTSECYGQRLQLRRALCAKHPGNHALFDLVEAGPGVVFPIETFTALSLDENAKLADGVEVDLEVLLSLKPPRARSPSSSAIPERAPKSSSASSDRRHRKDIMSFDFSAWKGPRSVAQIKADHAAEDARARRAAEAASKVAQQGEPTRPPAARKAA